MLRVVAWSNIATNKLLYALVVVILVIKLQIRLTSGQAIAFPLHVERGSSVVECRIRNRESPGSNPLCYHFEDWAFSFSSRRLSQLICINEYLAIDSGGNVSE